jgi:hypothetical protein
MKKSALLLVLGLLITAFISLAVGNSEKAEPAKYSTTVKLDISADDKIKNQVYSYLSRELRSLGDVKVVDDNLGWTIKVLAQELSNQAGHKTGIVMSSVYLKAPWADNRFALAANTFLRGMAEKGEDYVPDNEEVWAWPSVDRCLRSHLFFCGQVLQVGGPEDLQALCKNSVATFDAKFLIAERVLYQEFERLRKERSVEEADEKPKNY